MLRMVMWFSLLFFLYVLSSNEASQEPVGVTTLYDPSVVELRGLAHTGVPMAVSVGNEHFNEVSSSVVLAETWVRTHVLAHYPAANINTIVVGHNVLCNKKQEHEMGLVLPSMKNIFHSLTRWGLEREIKVSASFSSSCLHPSSALYRDELADVYIKPLLNFLQNTNSTYLVNPPPNLSAQSEEAMSLVSSHTESMKKLGFFNPNRVNVIITAPKGGRPMNRKLSFMDKNMVGDPFPARPTPLPPTGTPIGYSVPAYVATSPLPPLVGTVSPAPLSLPRSPELPPEVGPASPPHGFNLPPCNPWSSGSGWAAPPETGAKQGLWCVAKPSVPVETLQEALDYACGEGGADCEAITAHGNCYSPDTVVAHASYAFNSYWQKNKGNGGTCSFGGTAMIINADPSFRHCRFILA